jgi:hypothetical protein
VLPLPLPLERSRSSRGRFLGDVGVGARAAARMAPLDRQKSMCELTLSLVVSLSAEPQIGHVTSTICGGGGEALETAGIVWGSGSNSGSGDEDAKNVHSFSSATFLAEAKSWAMTVFLSSA